MQEKIPSPHHTTLGFLVSHRLVQKIEVGTIITKMIQGKNLGDKKEIMTSALYKKIWKSREGSAPFNLEPIAKDIQVMRCIKQFSTHSSPPYSLVHEVHFQLVVMQEEPKDYKTNTATSRKSLYNAIGKHKSKHQKAK